VGRLVAFQFSSYVVNKPTVSETICSADFRYLIVTVAHIIAVKRSCHASDAESNYNVCDNTRDRRSISLSSNSLGHC